MSSLPHHYAISGFFMFAAGLVLLGGVAPLMATAPQMLSSELSPGQLIRCGKSSAIYIIGQDGRRHAFPDRVTYRSWFKNERGVKQLKQNICNIYPAGANVTIRPGSVIIKFFGEKKIYAVSFAGLRHSGDIKMLRFLYPSKNKNKPDKSWQAALRTLPAARRADYVIGRPIVFFGGRVDFDSKSEITAAASPVVLFAPAAVCEYAAPLAGCTYMKGPNYNPISGCGMELQCSSAQSALIAPRRAPGSDSAGAAPLPSAAITPSASQSAAPSPAATATATPVVSVSPTPTAAAPSATATVAPSASPSAQSATVGVADAARTIRASASSQPPFNTRVTDTDFGTTIRRITNRVAIGSNGFATHIYSQLQAFSSDNQYVLLMEDDAYVVRRADTLARANDGGLSNINAPRWQPAVAHTLVHYDGNDDETLRVQYTNADTGRRETVFTFPASYQRIRSNQSFDELSHDGRWMAGMAALGNGDQMIFTLNLETRKLGAQISLNGLYNGVCARDPQYGAVEPDWVAVSPLGRYLVMQWVRDGVTRCSGLETFDIQTGQFVGRVFDRHEHGDLGVDKDGATEYFMTFENEHPSDPGRPSQGMRVLPGPATGVQVPKYLQIMNWGTEHHVSCQGPNGVCLVTAFLHNPDNPSEPWHPFDEELFLQYTDGRVLRLTHHRSTQCGYWVQPRASISRDGRYVIFASDWGINRCSAANDNLGRGEVYLIELPAGAVAAGPSKVSVSPTATATASATPVATATNTASPTPSASASAAPTASPTPIASATASPADGSGSPALGSVGPLPVSTYALGNLETFTFENGSERDTVYADPRMGEGTCFAADFIKYDVYASKDGSASYTYLGGHTGADAGQWVAGNSVDTGGCAKDRVVYTLHPGSGVYRIGLCITNIKNTSQRICKTISMTQ